MEKNKKQQRSIIYFVIILMTILFYGYYGIYKMIFVHFDLVGGDFRYQYLFAENYIKDRSTIYFVPEYDIIKGTGMNPIFYPPISLLVFLPFSILPYYQAKVIWFIICHIIILISGLIIYQLGRHENRLRSAIAMAVSLGFSMPLYGNLLTGHINLLIFLGLCLIYRLLLEGKESLISFILSVCVHLKVYPGFFIILFLRRLKLKQIVLFVFLSTVFGIASIGIFGLHEHYYFLKMFTSGLFYERIGAIQSMSLTMLIKIYYPTLNHNYITIVNAIFGLLLILLWIAKSKRAFNQSDERVTMIIDLFILTSILLLILPSSWIFYNAFLILPFYFIIFSIIEGKHSIKYSYIFILLFLITNFWEIIAYQIPISLDGYTIREIGKMRDSFHVLYPLLYSLPFTLNLLFYLWLLINYERLHASLKTFWKK